MQVQATRESYMKELYDTQVMLKAKVKVRAAENVAKVVQAFKTITDQQGLEYVSHVEGSYTTIMIQEVMKAA